MTNSHVPIAPYSQQGRPASKARLIMTVCCLSMYPAALVHWVITVYRSVVAFSQLSAVLQAGYICTEPISRCQPQDVLSVVAVANTRGWDALGTAATNLSRVKTAMLSLSVSVPIDAINQGLTVDAGFPKRRHRAVAGEDHLGSQSSSSGNVDTVASCHTRYFVFITFVSTVSER